MTPTTYIELASLSKTIATAFALEFFDQRGVSIDASVNEVLATTSSPFRLKAAPGADPSWPSQVKIRHLMDHTGLGMHYVHGIPMHHSMPSCLDILEGRAQAYGYAPLVVNKCPGEKFNYSGGGFIVLQHVIEAMCDSGDIEAITRAFLDSVGMNLFTFDPEGGVNSHVAVGHFDDMTQVPGNRLKFPAFAAGAIGAPSSLLSFWRYVTLALREPSTTQPISHRTASLMVTDPQDKGSIDFMNARMGMGAFLMRGGANQFVCHQAANEGFRGVYLYCVSGPNAGNGFAIGSNGDNKSVLTIANTMRLILLNAGWEGVNLERLKGGKETEHGIVEFDWSGLSQEEIVNRAYKELAFCAFDA
eukprot:c663_g1_i1.p1 GENE.c663_g1_i1~~c663_g1_i1.p1  ORF type:complete len:423 (+),score=72.01 c663_g1_i1:192-1271(+)